MTTIAHITGASGGIGQALERQLQNIGLQVADVMAWLLGDDTARLTAAGDRGGRRFHHRAASGEIDEKQIEVTTGSSE